MSLKPAYRQSLDTHDAAVKWAAKRQAQIQAAQKKKEARGDIFTEDHTFRPKVVTRTSVTLRSSLTPPPNIHFVHAAGTTPRCNDNDDPRRPSAITPRNNDEGILATGSLQGPERSPATASQSKRLSKLQNGRQLMRHQNGVPVPDDVSRKQPASPKRNQYVNPVPSDATRTPPISPKRKQVKRSKTPPVSPRIDTGLRQPAPLKAAAVPPVTSGKYSLLGIGQQELQPDEEPERTGTDSSVLSGRDSPVHFWDLMRSASECPSVIDQEFGLQQSGQTESPAHEAKLGTSHGVLERTQEGKLGDVDQTEAASSSSWFDGLVRLSTDLCVARSTAKVHRAECVSMRSEQEVLIAELSSVRSSEHCLRAKLFEQQRTAQALHEELCKYNHIGDVGKRVQDLHEQLHKQSNDSARLAEINIAIQNGLRLELEETQAQSERSECKAAKEIEAIQEELRACACSERLVEQNLANQSALLLEERESRAQSEFAQAEVKVPAQDELHAQLRARALVAQVCSCATSHLLCDNPDSMEAIHQELIDEKKKSIAAEMIAEKHAVSRDKFEEESQIWWSESQAMYRIISDKDLSIAEGRVKVAALQAELARFKQEASCMQQAWGEGADPLSPVSQRTPAKTSPDANDSVSSCWTVCASPRNQARK